MNYDENLENLKILTNNKKGFRHSFSDEFSLLPFQTREPDRPQFNNGFENILGEFSRLLHNKDWDKDLKIDDIIETILDNDDVECSDDDKKYLRLLLNDYLLDEDNKLNIVHPLLYMYIPRTRDESSRGELQIAEFFNEVMFKDFPQIKEFFNYDENNENILTRLVLDNLPKLPEFSSGSNKAPYIPKLDFIIDMFKKDMLFALDHEQFLNDNIENIMVYYYFLYITQLCLKVFKSDAELDKLDEIYYLFDSENVSKNRKTISKGYDLIKKNNRGLVDKIYTIDYINKIFGTKGYFLVEIINYYNTKDKNEQNDIIKAINEFNKEYNDKNNITKIYTPNNSIEEACQQLYDFLEDKNGSKLPVRSRYALCLEDVGKKYFLKRKGRYGYVLNITQDMLLTITALCITEDKIKLKQLFEEYEKRGLFFDKKTKIEIENLLTKLNLIDKKSDSGDAQYVKGIL